MDHESRVSSHAVAGIVLASGETPLLQPGDPVRILNRSPVGHYRVPVYLRGKTGWVEAVIEPRGIDNEEEGFGRNAGRKLHYYRVAILMTDIWARYEGSPTDGLRIEVYETWLEKV
jgi:hypothetical protein